MDYFYKGTIDLKPVKIKIIQTVKHRCEIIRLSQLHKSNGAGFWVNKADIISTPSSLNNTPNRILSRISNKLNNKLS